MALSYSQLEGVWIQAGGSSVTAPVAAAIAIAESGGNPNAHNPNPPDDSYGLWQINMLGSMGPSRRQQFGLNSNAALFDPLTNAKAAVALSGGGKNFGPWSTYTNGAFRTYLNGSIPPDLTGGNAAPVDNVATPVSLGSDLVSAFYPMFNIMGNTLIFGAAIAGGAILVGAGVYMLFKGTDPTAGVAAAQAIGTVGGPIGKAAVATTKTSKVVGL